MDKFWFIAHFSYSFLHSQWHPPPQIIKIELEVYLAFSVLVRNEGTSFVLQGFNQSLEELVILGSFLLNGQTFLDSVEYIALDYVNFVSYLFQQMRLVLTEIAFLFLEELIVEPSKSNSLPINLPVFRHLLLYLLLMLLLLFRHLFVLILHCSVYKYIIIFSIIKWRQCSFPSIRGYDPF